MSNPSDKTIIDVKQGNITAPYSEDKAVLVGVYPTNGSSYANNLELVLNLENSEPITIELPYSGYNMQLFIGDFTGDNKSEIMVRGGFGGSGGFEIGVIYKYENGKLVEIFNQDTFVNNNTCSSKFKPNYKAAVYCGKNKYLIDLSSKKDDYLDYIYSPDGKLISSQSPYVDAPSAILPIKQVYNNYYELLIQQRIVGIANADTLGVIQTLGSLTDSKFKPIYKGLLLPSYSLRPSKNSRPSYKDGLFNRNEIYYGREFNIDRDNLDLIVNSIYEDRNTLYVDGYLLNLTDYPISRIDDFTLNLFDSNRRLFAQKTFYNVGIQGSLRPYEGKRVLFTFFYDEYSLLNADTNNISWNYNYNIR